MSCEAPAHTHTHTHTHTQARSVWTWLSSGADIHDRHKRTEGIIFQFQCPIHNTQVQTLTAAEDQISQLKEEAGARAAERQAMEQHAAAQESSLVAASDHEC